MMRISLLLFLVYLSGCATSPSGGRVTDAQGQVDNAKARDYLFYVAGKLSEHGITVQNIEEGVGKDNVSFMEFKAANATLKIGLKPQETITQRKQHFGDLIKTIARLGEIGLEVREFLFIPSDSCVVEFCGGRLTIQGPQLKSPSTAPAVAAVIAPRKNDSPVLPVSIVPVRSTLPGKGEKP